MLAFGQPQLQLTLAPSPQTSALPLVASLLSSPRQHRDALKFLAAGALDGRDRCLLTAVANASGAHLRLSGSQTTTPLALP